MPLSHFFQDVEVMNLGEVTELRIRPYTSVIANTIKVGYKDNSYENADGKGEFNTELQFSTPVRTTKITKDLTIPYRADSYGVEYVLIDFAKEDTADSDADNDVFLIKRNGSIVERNPPAITGTFADDTMFNGILSPKQTLLRNANLISTMLDKIQPVDGYNVIFGSSKKDRDVAINGVQERVS